MINLSFNSFFKNGGKMHIIQKDGSVCIFNGENYTYSAFKNLFLNPNSQYFGLKTICKLYGLDFSLVKDGCDLFFRRSSAFTPLTKEECFDRTLWFIQDHPLDIFGPNKEIAEDAIFEITILRDQFFAIKSRYSWFDFFLHGGYIDFFEYGRIDIYSVARFTGIEEFANIVNSKVQFVHERHILRVYSDRCFARKEKTHYCGLGGKEYVMTYDTEHDNLYFELNK